MRLHSMVLNDAQEQLYLTQKCVKFHNFFNELCFCVCLCLYAILVFPRFLCAVKCAVAGSLIATCV
jgi:hypothetical protein